MGLIMAYFAQIENNIIQQVIKISNQTLDEPTLQFPDTEPIGQAFIANTLGFAGTWKQTSYNASFRKHFAGIGYTYDETLDAFIPPKPYPSWLLDTNTCTWYAPVPYPNDGNMYQWDEATQQWVLFDPT